jgi:outer membrane protein TolC
MSYEVQKLELKKAEAFTELYYTNQENCAQLKSIDDWYLKANKIVANYKEVLTISRRQYQNGGISTLNLTDQELRLLDAELSLIDAIFARQEVLANQWLLHDGTLAFFNK